MAIEIGAIDIRRRRLLAAARSSADSVAGSVVRPPVGSYGLGSDTATRAGRTIRSLIR